MFFLGFWESFFHFSEEFKLLIFLVSNHTCISVIGEICDPFNIGGVIFANRSQYNLSLDACHLMGWFGWNNFVSDWASHVTDFNNSDLPWGTIGIINLNDWIKLSWRSSGESGSFNFIRNDGFEVEFLE